MRNRINIYGQLDFMDFFLAFLYCIIFTIVCTFFSAKVFHWFIVPLIPCGVLIGADAVGWFRKKYSLFL